MASIKIPRYSRSTQGSLIVNPSSTTFVNATTDMFLEITPECRCGSLGLIAVRYVGTTGDINVTLKASGDFLVNGKAIDLSAMDKVYTLPGTTSQANVMYIVPEDSLYYKVISSTGYKINVSCNSTAVKIASFSNL